MTQDLDTLRGQLIAAIESAASLDALEAVRVEALGKQGSVTTLLKTLGKMSPEERQVEGPRINGLREAVATGIATRKEALERAALDARLASETLDMTLPAEAPLAGTVHPVSQVMDELAEIFADLGFAVATGPEIETDWHNFSALNIPKRIRRARCTTPSICNRGSTRRRTAASTSARPSRCCARIRRRCRSARC